MMIGLLPDLAAARQIAPKALALKNDLRIVETETDVPVRQIVVTRSVSHDCEPVEPAEDALIQQNIPPRFSPGRKIRPKST